MNFRLEGALKKGRATIIIAIILWLLMAIVFIMPLTCGIHQIELLGRFDDDGFLRVFTQVAFNPVLGVKSMIKEGIVGDYFRNLIGFSLFYGLLVGFGIARLMPKHRYDGTEHGSSDWSAFGEQYRVLSKHKGIILAENNYLPLDKRGNVNVLIVGGSGSGKSSAYSIPNAHQRLGSYVFTDPKGELYDATAGYLREHGYKIKVFNLVRPQFSDGYNPLVHINSEIDVDVIANTIVKGQKSDGEKSSDPFWDDSAEMLLKALIYYLMAKRPEEEQNLASCAELVRAANSNGGSNLLTELMSELPYDHPARMNYKSIEIAPEKTYSSILSTLQSKLGKFDSKEIAELTSTNTINFEDIGTEKTAVYVISSDTHGAYDFLLTIFFSQMIQRLYDFADLNGGKLKERTYFILDEFANIGRIPDFDKKISTSRSRGISFSVILQNLDQLEEIYDKAYETIIGNCDTHVFLGSNSQKTVEYFSKALGEKTISHESISTNRDVDYKRTGLSNSDQILARALMTPDELRRMDNDLCIIFEKGIKPIKAKKYYYFNKPMIRELEKFSIDHNDIGEIDRGKWRKYNPYNPVNDDDDNDNQKTPKDLKIDSLDDLFDDEETEEKVEKPHKELEENEEENINTEKETVKVAKKGPKLKDLNIDEALDSPKEMLNKMDKEDEAPQLPMDEDNEGEEDEYDLQKELEAKFDELFGPIDDEEDE